MQYLCMNSFVYSSYICHIMSFLFHQAFVLVRHSSGKRYMSKPSRDANADPGFGLDYHITQLHYITA